MIRRYKQQSLKKINTFGIEAIAGELVVCDAAAEIMQVYQDAAHQGRIMCLGGGSNVLFTENYDGIVLQPEIDGIRIVSEDHERILVKAGAGVVWDSFVQWAVDHHFGGIENLSLIPGRVGACPIQNIGAYGSEVKEVIDQVTFINLDTLQEESLPASKCAFGYRTSIFKTQLKGRFVITQVQFSLNKKPQVNLQYGALQDALKNVDNPGVADVREAVCNIRRSKLPDPDVIGNAGSFFKNPSVTRDYAEGLRGRFADIPMYATAHEMVKIPAGWMIEKCGWKGYREGDAGVHQAQALVLVNYGNAKGKDILSLSEKIKESVASAFGIELETEVNIV